MSHPARNVLLVQGFNIHVYEETVCAADVAAITPSEIKLVLAFPVNVIHQILLFIKAAKQFHQNKAGMYS